MTRSSVVLVYGLLVLSGFAGLGYQSVWIRMLGQGLGHDYIAVLGVVAAFFCGLSLGGLLLDRRVSTSARPGAWYAGLEIIVGLWALVLIAAIPAINRFLPTILGVAPSPVLHWSVAFLVPFLLLLPATVAMGGTLPAADRLVARLSGNGNALGGVYAANTLGAMAGILLTTFVIVQTFGHSGTLITLAVANFLCAAGLLLGPAKGEGALQPPKTNTQRQESASLPLLGVLFATGFLGIGYEVVAVRALSQILENTVFSFASVLAVYLLGTALGAALYQRLSRDASDRMARLIAPTRLMQFQALACLSGVLGLMLAPALYGAPRILPLPPSVTAIAGEMVAGAAVFLIPTIFMGAVFTALAGQLRRSDGGIGAALAANTLGATTAPILMGTLILPAIGIIPALIAMSLGYLLLLPGRTWQALMPRATVTAVGAFFLFGPVRPDLLRLPDGATLKESIEGVMATVTVYQDQTGITHLEVNNHYVMGGTASLAPDRRQGHTPLLMHPDPKRALFLGVGTGATFAAAAYHQQVEADAVELVPEVLDVLPYFKSVSGEIEVEDRLRLYTADARRFVEATDNTYDVIIADTFHPSRDGAGLLYTVEHFAAVKARLAEGGLFCQWLPLHQLDIPTLRLIIRTFLSVYPDGFAVMNDFSLETPVIGLVGGHGRLTLPVGAPVTEPLLTALAKTKALKAVRPLDGYLAGSKPLKAFAGTGPLNTDDRPLVLFQAPRSVYAGLEHPSGRLLHILEGLDREPAGDIVSADLSERVEAYWQARDAFVRLGAGMDRTVPREMMIAALSEPLLDIVRMSPDFAAAYDPLLSMSAYLLRRNPPRAKALLEKLRTANPARNEATEILRRMFPGSIPSDTIMIFKEE